MAGKLQSVNRKIVVTKISQNFREATELLDAPIPQPGPGQVLVKNRYAGINASDINLTAARYDPAFAPTQVPFDCGFEGLGEVVTLGDGVKNIRSGQPVAYMNFGAFSEYTVIPAKLALPVPAVKPEYIPFLVSGLTASISLDKVGELKAGEVVLVTAAAGGTGQFAVQLAKKRGCHVIGTCSSEEKVQFLKELGCDRPINYSRESIKDVLKKEYKKGVDVVYETIGGDVFDTCLTNLAVKGRLIVIGYIEGYKGDVGFIPSKKAGIVQPIVLSKSASVRGFLMNHYMSLWPEYLGKLIQMYEKGELASTVDNGKFSPHGPFRGLDSVAYAVDYLYSKKSVGKIVVEFPSSPKSQL